MVQFWGRNNSLHRKAFHKWNNVKTVDDSVQPSTPSRWHLKDWTQVFWASYPMASVYRNTIYWKSTFLFKKRRKLLPQTGYKQCKYLLILEIQILRNYGCSNQVEHGSFLSGGHGLDLPSTLSAVIWEKGENQRVYAIPFITENNHLMRRHTPPWHILIKKSYHSESYTTINKNAFVSFMESQTIRTCGSCPNPSLYRQEGNIISKMEGDVLQG